MYIALIHFAYTLTLLGNNEKMNTPWLKNAHPTDLSLNGIEG